MLDLPGVRKFDKAGNDNRVVDAVAVAAVAAGNGCKA